MGSGAAVSAYIGLGANLGDAADTLAAALRALSGLPTTRVLAASPVFRTAPIDAAGPDFLNAVVQIETRLPAELLLRTLQRIESDHGRARPYRHAPRTLDLDLLLYGEAIIQTPHLTVPHPRLHERAFVLVPLAELAPQLHVPGLGAVSDALHTVADQRIERTAQVLTLERP